MQRMLRRAQVHIAVLLILFSGAASSQTQISPIYAQSASGQYYPMGQAVDGNPWTFWLAGAGAPQWIQIDLGSEKRLSLINLLTAQTPDGYSVHEIHGRSASGEWVAYYGAFSQYTYDYQWLSMPVTSTVPVRYLFIYTTSSPSWVAWREVQVFEAAPPPPASTVVFSETWTSRPCIAGTLASEFVISAGDFGTYNMPPADRACTGSGNRYYLGPKSTVESTYAVCGSDPATRRNCTAVAGANELQIRGSNTTGAYASYQEGYYLVSEKQFSPSDHLVIEAKARFVCTEITNGTWEGCFFGIGLYNGEGDYKNVMLYHDRNGINATFGYGKTEVINGVREKREVKQPEYGLILQPNGTFAAGVLNPIPTAEEPTQEFSLKLEFIPATNTTQVYVNGTEIANSTSSGGFSGNPRVAIHIASTGPFGSARTPPSNTASVRLKSVTVTKIH